MIFQVETPLFCRYACYKCNGDISPEIFRVDIKETTASLSKNSPKGYHFGPCTCNDPGKHLLVWVSEPVRPVDDPSGEEHIGYERPATIAEDVLVSILLSQGTDTYGIPT